MKKSGPIVSAELQKTIGLDMDGVREHIQTCPRDHYSNGECVPDGGDPFMNLEREYKLGKRTINQLQLARDLREALAMFVKLIDAICVRSPDGFTIENMFDASYLSEGAREVQRAFKNADTELNAAHAKELPGQPGVYFWSPVEDREHSLLTGAIARARSALMWPADRYSDDMVRYGRPGDQFRPRDVITPRQSECLRSALGGLELLTMPGEKQTRSKKKRAPGRPLAETRERDERLKAAWETGQHNSHAALERAFGLKPGECRRALDRLRKDKTGK